MDRRSDIPRAELRIEPTAEGSISNRMRLAVWSIITTLLSPQPALANPLNKACTDESATVACKKACGDTRANTADVVATCQNSKAAIPDYMRGVQFFRESKYDEALIAFGEAYKIFPGASLEHNMARCHELLGQLEEAVKLYEKYLESNPKDAEIIRARVKTLREKLEASKAPKKVKPKPLKPTPPAVVVKPSKAKKIAGGVTLGVGAAALASGAALIIASALQESQLNDRAKSGGMWTDEARSAWELQKELETAGIITLASGATLAIVGGVLLIIYRKGGKESTASTVVRKIRLTPTDSGGMTTGLGFEW